MNTLFDFRDTTAIVTAIVTASSRSIGGEIAAQLQHCDSFAHIFDHEPSTSTVSTNIEWHQVDVRDSDSVADTTASLPDDTTLLVNNAGITRDRALTEMSGGALSQTALDCLPEPAGVARTVLFLLSDAVRMITGEVPHVDSGQHS